MPTKNEVRDTRRGYLISESIDHNGNTTEKNMGFATYIVESTKTFETRIIELVLEFEYGGAYETIKIKRSQLQDKELLQYADYGLNVSRGNIKQVVEFIQKQEKHHIPKMVHEGLGFDTLKDKNTGEIKPIFKAFTCLGMKSKYVGAYNIKPTRRMKSFRACSHYSIDT